MLLSVQEITLTLRPQDLALLVAVDLRFGVTPIVRDVLSTLGNAVAVVAGASPTSDRRVPTSLPDQPPKIQRLPQPPAPIPLRYSPPIARRAFFFFSFAGPGIAAVLILIVISRRFLVNAINTRESSTSSSSSPPSPNNHQPARTGPSKAASKVCGHPHPAPGILFDHKQHCFALLCLVPLCLRFQRFCSQTSVSQRGAGHLPAFGGGRPERSGRKASPPRRPTTITQSYLPLLPDFESPRVPLWFPFPLLLKPSHNPIQPGLDPRSSPSTQVGTQETIFTRIPSFSHSLILLPSLFHHRLPSSPESRSLDCQCWPSCESRVSRLA